MGFEGSRWSFWFVMSTFVSFGCECIEKAEKKRQGLFGDGGLEECPELEQICRPAFPCKI